MIKIISEYFYCLIYVLSLTSTVIYLSQEEVSLKRLILFVPIYAMINYLVTGVNTSNYWEFISINLISLICDCFYVSYLFGKLRKEGIFHATLVNLLYIFSVNSIIHVINIFIKFNRQITLTYSVERLIMVGLINLSVIGIVVGLNKLKIIPKNNIISTQFELFVMINIIVYSAMLIIYNIGVINLVDLITVLVFILLIMWAVFLKILAMYVEMTIKNEELIMEEISNKYIDKYIEFYQHESDNLRKLKHDLKNYQNVLENLDKMNQYYKYIDEVFEEVNQFNYMESGNIYLDACLYAKQQEYPDIIYDYNIGITGLEFNEKDLTSLLFNLIDNACSEAMKNDRHVYLMIKYVNKKLVIIVKNKCLTKPTFISTKGSKHGYGLRIIKSIVNKYNGDLSMDYRDNQVIFKIKINT